MGEGEYRLRVESMTLYGHLRLSTELWLGTGGCAVHDVFGQAEGDDGLGKGSVQV